MIKVIPSKITALLLGITLLIASAGCSQTPEPVNTDNAAEQEGIPLPGQNENKAIDAETMDLSTLPKGLIKGYAEKAIKDMISNYWVDGGIKTTWNGYPVGYEDDTASPEPRGAIWSRTTLLMPAYNYYAGTGDDSFNKYVQDEWNTVKTIFTFEELTTASKVLNTAVDDCGWNAYTYLDIYDLTKDEYALNVAKALMNSAFDLWLDDAMGGGLWYNEKREQKSVYQIGALLSSLKIYELTGDRVFYDRMLKCYDWIEEKLVRKDGIFFADYNESGPVGEFRADDIHEAGSVTFLAGNFGMSVLNARLYKLTNEQKYLDRAVRTANGIQQVLVRKGRYLNDRDAWANGTFFYEYVKEVLQLQGVDPKQKEAVYRTAVSIANNARTVDGFYGGSWNGPAEGPGSAWYSVGSKPQQIMTSGSTVMMLVGAAYLEGKDESK